MPKPLGNRASPRLWLLIIYRQPSSVEKLSFYLELWFEPNFSINFRADKKIKIFDRWVKKVFFFINNIFLNINFWIGFWKKNIGTGFFRTEFFLSWQMTPKKKKFGRENFLNGIFSFVSFLPPPGFRWKKNPKIKNFCRDRKKVEHGVGWNRPKLKPRPLVFVSLSVAVFISRRSVRWLC